MSFLALDEAKGVPRRQRLTRWQSFATSFVVPIHVISVFDVGYCRHIVIIANARIGHVICRQASALAKHVGVAGCDYVQGRSQILFLAPIDER